MKVYSCLIVDDEPIARQIIESYLEHLPALYLVASCKNALEARSILLSQSIDILFLDINMPILDGLAFVKTLKQLPQVVFTTAYKEYAVDAFDIEAVDYLLKPFSLDRFIKAVDKAIDRIRPSQTIDSIESVTENYFFLKADGKIYKIEYNDIKYAEAYGNFTKLHLTHSILIPSMSFTAIQQLLSGTKFIRVHRSYIINKSKIDHIDGNRVFIQKSEIPISNNFKEEFLKEIGIV